MMVRKARVPDVKLIYELLKGLGEKGMMLPRSLSELYDVVRSFLVACPEDHPERIVGACALHVCWEDLGEIRSLAVASEYRGQDIGRLLVEAVLEDGRRIGLHRLFVLTYIPDYFKKYGFNLTEKSRLPHKIWADCLKCVKFPDCGEIAMERDL